MGVKMPNFLEQKKEPRQSGGIPMPNLLSGSGRAATAYFSTDPADAVTSRPQKTESLGGRNRQSLLAQARNADRETIPTGLTGSSQDWEERSRQLQGELSRLERSTGQHQSGLSMASVYGADLSGIRQQVADNQKRMAEIRDELWRLEQGGQYSYRQGLERREEKAEEALRAASGPAAVSGRELAEMAERNPQGLRGAMAGYQTAEEKVQALAREKERLDYLRRYDGKTYEDTFTGQFGANSTLGRISQDESLAWNRYLSEPTEENRKYAEALGELSRSFQGRNAETLADDGTLPWVSKTLANYLPQLWDQTKAGAAGAAAGGLAGSVVPIVGTALGVKGGIVAGSGAYSYATMRGAAFRSLLELGVDEETAKRAAQDEALIATMIEMADTGFDLATLGGGKLISLLGKKGIKGLGKWVAEWAGESGARKLAVLLAKYGINIGGEMLEEGSQEAVSIANAGRILDGRENGVLGLAGEGGGVFWDAARGRNPENAEQIWAAAKEGGKIAAMVGGGQMALNQTAAYLLDKRQMGQQKTASRTEAAGEYGESRPQNVDMPAVPIIQMKRGAYADKNGSVPALGNPLRGDAIQRARTRLGLNENPAAYIPASNVLRNGEEYVLKVTKSSLNKMIHPANEKAIPIESIIVLDNLERIANNGVWKSSEGDRKGRQQIKGFDHLMTTVYIDNAPYLVDMRVRLVREAAGKATDNVLYYFTPEEILSVEKVDASSPTVKRRAFHMAFRDSASTTNNVTQSGGSVKNATSTQGGRMAELGASFGESGARAFAAAKPGQGNLADYYAGFAAYYQAGLTGMKQAAVRSEYGKMLSDGQRFAAYVAGQNDAAAKQVEMLEGKENTAQEGGVRFSLKTVGGKQIVWLEENALTNKELQSHSAVAAYIAQHIGEFYTIIESGQKVYIGKDLPREYTQSKYTTYLRNNKNVLLRAKNRVVNDFGLLIESATNRRWEKTKHTQSKDARYGIYRYDSAFAFPTKDQAGNIAGVRAYDIELLIRNASDGKKYLYDIVNIKENTVNAIDLQQREIRLATNKAAPRSDVSNVSIPEDGENGNTDFFLKDASEGSVSIDLAAQEGLRAGEAFGESGAKAFAAANPGQGNLADYYAGFAAYYQAGLTGMKQAAVRSEYGKMLSDGQKFAAYVAGQNDAAASLTREQRAAQFAPVAGTDSGLVFDEYVEKTLEKTVAEQVNRVSKLLGLRVRFVDSVRDGTANAQIQGAEVLVEKGNPHPLRFLLGHEWTHRLQELAPKAYRKFRDFAAQDPGVAQYVEEKLEQYRAKGMDLSYETALDEAVADYAGRMLEDGRVLDEFIARNRENRTLLERIRDAIRGLVRRLKGAEQRQAQLAEKKLSKALDAAAKVVEKQTQPGYTEEKRYSLKEDLQNGRAREESREGFLQRCAGGGYEVFEGDAAAYGYRAPERVHLGSGQIQEALSTLGIEAWITDGTVLWNANGISSVRDVPEAVTIERKTVFISNTTEIPALNAAGHEAFHFWKKSAARDTYVETLENQLNFSSNVFLSYQAAISDAYCSDSVELSDSTKMKKLHEELFAYISGDIHEGTNEDFLRPMFRDFDAVKAAWETLVETQKNTAQEGGKARFAIKYDRANTPYVVIEEDILAGVPQAEWVKTVKDNLRKKFPEGVVIGKQIIKVNSQSRREMTFSNYMQIVFKKEPTLYRDKLRATNNANEIMQATKNWVNEALQHPRTDDIIDFARGELRLRIGMHDYSAQVIVGNRGESGLMLYDLIDLKKIAIQKRKKTVDTAYTANTQTELRDRQAISTTNSITESGEKGNTDFPLKGASLAQEQLRQVGKALGESGAKAFAAAKPGRGNLADYFAGFAAYYQAGLTGMKQAAVRSENGKKLSQGQKFAAYVAGQNDAAAKRAKALEGKENTAQEGGEARFSIKYDSENIPYVAVEEDILAGIPRAKWVKTVKENLRKKFPDGVRMWNNVVEIDRQSIREMTYSQYTQRLMETEPTLYADKLRATNSVDEILKASRNFVNEALLHPRKDNIQEFARGEVHMQIGVAGYTAQVVVAMRSTGKLLLYDILGMNPITIKAKNKKSDAAITENPSPGADRSTASGFTDSISQENENSNTDFSLKGASKDSAAVDPAAQARRRAGEAFGESGAKAFAAAKLGRGNLADYYAGFAAYYQAGLTGMKQAAVRSEYGKMLSDGQKFAAYVAGQNDAAASLAQEQRAAQFAPVAGTDSGLVFDAYVEKTLEKTVAEQVNRVSKLLGLRVRFVDSVRDGTANAQIQGAEVLVEKGNPHPLRFLLGHEWTHRLQELAPKAYRKFRDFAAQDPGVAQYVEEKLEQYRAKGMDLSYETALDEAVADYAGRMLEDGRVLDEFIARNRENRTLLERIRDAIRGLIQKLKGAEQRQAQLAEEKLSKALDAAAKRVNALEGKENTAREGGEARYWLNTDFGRQFDEWMEQTDEVDRRAQSRGYFQIGTTSDALKSIGVRAGTIYWRKQKIGYIMADHTEMDAETIKQVPNIVENPVIVLKSSKRDDSIVLFGDVVAADGRKVMAALELTPRSAGGMEAEFSLVTSAYGRSDENLRNLIHTSEILFLNPNKKRTDTWLMSIRVQFPSDQPVYGSIGSISYKDGKVNIVGKTLAELGSENSKPTFSLKGASKVSAAIDPAAREGLRAGETFGESGAKAFAAAKPGRGNLADYYAGFAAYYQAGLTGMKQAAVRSEYGKKLSDGQRFAAYVAGQNDAAAKRAKALAGKENTAREGGEARYSIDANFAQNVQDWYDEGQSGNESFVLGSTGPVLQGLGAIESDIYMNGNKISLILEQHAEMTIQEIQRIPEILEDPILILKSKNKTSSQYGNSRLVLFGTVRAADGRPIMCVMDLRPTEDGFLLNDMQKVSSAYTKDYQPMQFISQSDVLHADKKRTVPLLRSIGFTLPMSLLQNGSLGSISYSGTKVNLSGVKFDEVVSNNAVGEARQSLKGASKVSAAIDPAAQEGLRAGEAFGESGAKAFAAANPGQGNLADYYAGFAAYYQAGLTGMKQAAVRSEYGKKLSQGQKFAAYVAGQNDAAAKQVNALVGKENTAQEGGEAIYSFKGYNLDSGEGIYEGNFPLGTAKSEKAARILKLIQDLWSKKPINLVIHNEDGGTKTIQARFDPTYDSSGNTPSDATKLMGGNRHGTAAEKRITLDLADDYYQIASEATYHYSKAEEGKTSEPHQGVNQWHYFVNDILFQEHGQKEMTPYRVTINVKARNDGHYVYSFNAERQDKRLNTRRTLHADVNHTRITGEANAQPFNISIPISAKKSKPTFSLKGASEGSAAVGLVVREQLRRAGEALGENGQKTLQTAYDGALDTASYYGGFAAYYTAGLLGRNANQVDRAFAAALSPAQRQAAYEAGRKDAAEGTDFPVLSRGREGKRRSAAEENPQLRQRRKWEELGATLGKAGSRAFASGYDQDLDAEQAFAGFAAIYDAALGGEAPPQTQQTAALPEELRLAAEKAGEQDATRGAQARHFGKKAGLVRDAMHRSMGLSARTSAVLDAVGKLAGVEVRFVDKLIYPGTGQEGNACYENGAILISKNTKSPVRAALVHEIIHRMREISPDAYRSLADFLRSNLSEETWDGKRLSMAERYQIHETDRITEEMVADAFGKLLGDSAALERFVLAQRSTAQRAKALAGKENTAREGGEARYWLNTDFGRQFDAWLSRYTPAERNNSFSRFLIGTTSKALQSIGMSDYKIYWNSAKIARIMEKHPAMTPDVIKRVPEVLEYPILVMQSQTVANRITVLGETMAADGETGIGGIGITAAK